jgi:hypothetical protein
VRAETCSDVTCVIYTRKEVVAKEAIITVFICRTECFKTPSEAKLRTASNTRMVDQQGMRNNLTKSIIP